MKTYSVNIKGSGTKEEIVQSLKKMIVSLDAIEQKHFDLIDSHCLDDGIMNFHMLCGKDPLEKPLELFRNDMSARAYNLLKNDMDIKTLREISKLSRTDIRKHRNCGDHTLQSIEKLAAKHGLTLNK